MCVHTRLGIVVVCETHASLRYGCKIFIRTPYSLQACVCGRSHRWQCVRTYHCVRTHRPTQLQRCICMCMCIEPTPTQLLDCVFVCVCVCSCVYVFLYDANPPGSDVYVRRLLSACIMMCVYSPCCMCMLMGEGFYVHNYVCVHGHTPYVHELNSFMVACVYMSGCAVHACMCVIRF